MLTQEEVSTDTISPSNTTSDVISESPEQKSLQNSETMRMDIQISFHPSDYSYRASKTSISDSQKHILGSSDEKNIEENLSVGIPEGKVIKTQSISERGQSYDNICSIRQEEQSKADFHKSALFEKKILSNENLNGPKMQQIIYDMTILKSYDEDAQFTQNSKSGVSEYTTTLSNILPNDKESHVEKETEPKAQNSLIVLTQLDEIFDENREAEQIKSLSSDEQFEHEFMNQNQNSNQASNSFDSTKDSIQLDEVIKLDKENEIKFFFAKQLEQNREFAKAIEQYKTILESLKFTNSENSLEYAYVKQNLGFAQWSNGFTAEAKQSLLSCIRIRQQLQTTQSLILARIFTVLVSVEERLGNFDSSLDYAFRALSIYKQKFESQENQQFAKIYNNIGNTLRFLSRYEEALSYYQKSLAIKKVVFGEKHKDYANTLSNIGLTYYKKSMFYEAKSKLHQVLKIYEEDWATIEQKAETMTTIGAVLNAMGRYAQAKQTLEEALKFREQNFGTKHIMCGYTLYHLGVIYHKLKRYQKAQQTFRETLDIFENFGQAKGRYTAGTLSHLASLYLETERFQKAMDSIDLSLNLYEINPDLDYVKYCSTVNEKGNIYRLMGLDQKAQQLYNQAISTFRKRKIDDLVENAKLSEDLCMLQMKRSHYTKAMDYINKAIQIRQKRFGHYHLETAKARQLKNQIQTKFHSK